MTTKLINAPLMLALTQVRFTSFPEFSEQISFLQKQFREINFPSFDEGQAQEITLSDNGHVVNNLDVWTFSNKENNASITLTKDFITFVTSDYQTHKEFERDLLPILNILYEVPGFNKVMATRVGLRYIDSIKLSSGQSWKDLLKEGFIGPSLNNDIMRYFSETQKQTSDGILKIKCLRDDSGAALPPDLMKVGLTLKETLKPKAGEFRTFLDFDHFTSEQNDIAPQAILETINCLHKETSKAFKDSIIEKGFKNV